jgi:hypothetical protein
MQCVSHKFLKNVHEDSMQFPIQNSWFLCNRPNGPLKSSRRPAMSRSFSVEDARTLELHRPDVRSSLSNFYTELDFSRHYLRSFCKTSGRRGSTSRRYPVFQNILGFLYGRGKEWQWRTVRTLGQAVRTWSCYGKNRAILVRQSQKTVRMRLTSVRTPTRQSPNLSRIKFSLSL